MRIIFKEKTPSVIVEEIQEALGGRKLGKILNFNLIGRDLRVSIQKMGTSELEFKDLSNQKTGVNWELTKEKIALAHKPFKAEMMGKLTKIIDSIGGKVDNA